MTGPQEFEAGRTPLSWPEGDLSRRCYANCSDLPESIDVLRWLEAERGAAVALLATNRAWTWLELMYGAQNRACGSPVCCHKRASGRCILQPYQDKYGAMYGATASIGEDWGAPKQRGDTVDGPRGQRSPFVDELIAASAED